MLDETKGPGPKDDDRDRNEERDGDEDQQKDQDKKQEDKKQDKDQKDGDDKKQEDGNKPGKKRKPLWPWFLGGAIALIFIVFVLYEVLAPQPVQYTNDAYVRAHYSSVAPRIAGQVTQVLVNDNERVHAGQLLVTLDDRDMRAALAEAEATLDSDRARIDVASAQEGRQPSLIRQADAQVASAQARLDLAQEQATRYTRLANTGAGTVQQRQQADVQLRQEQAALNAAQAQQEAAHQQQKGAQAEVQAAKTRVVMDQARVRQAELNLSYTRITAQIDGVVAQRSVQVGNYLTPGSPIMVLVPLDDIYVTANYREVALRHMRPGQHARIHVDAYDIDLDGVVDSLPPASGAVFSPIPPNNATGNFTKIVQRLPVKIVFAPHQPLVNLVRVGMSVETYVDTNLADVVAMQQGQSVPVTARSTTH